MRSLWYELKPRAIRLRRHGLSIRDVEQKLKIPRSTLSGWFRDIKLSSKQRKKLYGNWKNALLEARKKAAEWHRTQKIKRLYEAENSAKITLAQINLKDKHILEIALALLYLGEGSKKNDETALGSSDPLILKFFLTALQNIYNIPVTKIRCELGLRADQNPDKLKRFWSKELHLPLSCFRQVNIDKRTEGSKTYSYYKGVCHIRCGSVAIQRKLVFLSRTFCKEITERTWTRSSAG
ncbi:MAG: hypothetical protein Q8P55_01570 [bacterium]|nr:hypothetical protein [bacterium]